MAAPTAEKFSWAGGALCEFSPACGLFASTLRHAVPVCAGATGLGFGAATAGTAASALMANVAKAAAQVFLIILSNLRSGEPVVKAPPTGFMPP